MSVTGIVLFVIFLLVKSLLDKKKKEARRQKAPESSASLDEMGGTAETTQVMAENPTEVRDLLQAVVLAEIIGRPKAQRRRSPYFRP